MWIDSHCHLDAAEFGPAHAATARAAAGLEVAWIVVPAVERGNFAAVATLAGEHPNCCYALGIHPMYTPQAEEADLAALRAMLPAALADPRLVAIGEIGLDLFMPQLKTSPLLEKQEHFFREQLKIARDFGLPVLLHVRRSQDLALKHLRQIQPPGGIAHAFNGSFQQAQAFVRLGFKLGIGGAMTFPRALQIRRLAAQMPLESLVLETDAPDISPSWRHPETNTPEEIPRIGAVLAQLRGLTLDVVAAATSANACAALPRLGALRGAPP